MSKEFLIEESIRKGTGQLTNSGSLAVTTGQHTGRSAQFRYIVNHPEFEASIDWGNTNRPLPQDLAEGYFDRLKDELNEDSYNMKGYVGPFSVEVRSTSPWHVAFALNMFRSAPIASVRASVQPKTIKVWHMPYAKANQLANGYEDETLILLDLKNLEIGIVGTAYAGEIKKAAFSACNFLLPEFGIFPMHSSANCLEDGGHSSLLFGLSGTGKTTLSASPDRSLIGDDEIIWTQNGLSNLEGGCYAKLIHLTKESEPEIYRAANKHGAILENVVVGRDSRDVDFDDDSLTENTRGSYDISALANVFDQSQEAAQPRTIVFLTADAFGALPAVAKLNPYQAQYHFISGYTAKVAGTELGVTEPTTAFSACFGAPFMPRHPSVYAKMLAEKAENAGATVWLLNTGWVGGCEKGSRFPLKVSRRLLQAIQEGELDNQPMIKHPVFGFDVPQSCPDVESHWLQIPQGPQVKKLAQRFIENFTKFSDHVAEAVIEKGGPSLEETSNQRVLETSL